MICNEIENENEIEIQILKDNNSQLITENKEIRNDMDLMNKHREQINSKMADIHLESTFRFCLAPFAHFHEFSYLNLEKEIEMHVNRSK